MMVVIVTGFRSQCAECTELVERSLVGAFKFSFQFESLLGESGFTREGEANENYDDTPREGKMLRTTSFHRNLRSSGTARYLPDSGKSWWSR